jgi:hypothetical protein
VESGDLSGPTEERAPGWYTDPKDASRRRYWDGERWSELAAGTGTTRRVDASHPGADTDRRPLLVALAALTVVALGTVGWVVTRDDDTAEPSPTTAGTSDTTTSASPGSPAPAGDPTPTSAGTEPTATQPADPSETTTTSSEPTSQPDPAALVPCQVDDQLLLGLLRQHPPLEAFADELVVERVRCLGDWASAIAYAESTDSALALFRRDQGTWSFVLLGSAEPCTALGIPPEAEPGLGCDEWTSG